MIGQKGLIDLYTHDDSSFDSKNGYNYVSLTEYKFDVSFNPLFESFTCHTLTSLSLLIDKSIKVEKSGERETYFDDEVFCYNFVSKDNIKGIILPEHLLNLPVRDVPCLSSDINSYTKNYISHWISCMEKYFKMELSLDDINRVINSYDKFNEIMGEYECPSKWIHAVIQTQKNRYGEDLIDVLSDILQKFWAKKLAIFSPTYIDVLKQINKDNYPIYVIETKKIKRFN